MPEDDLGSMPFWKLPADAYEALLMRVERRKRPGRDMVPRRLFPEDTHLVTIHRAFAFHKHYTVQQAFEATFEGWARRIFGQNPADDAPPPVYEGIAVRPGDERLALTDAVLVFDHPDGKRLVVKVSMSAGHEDPSSHLWVTCALSDKGFTEAKLQEVRAWVKEHNYLRGQKLLFSGRFVPLDPAYGWGDLYAEPALITVIRRNTEGFLGRLGVYKGLKLPTKRGVLLHGRPGSGKTLIGKILASQLDTTFIVVKPGELGSVSEIARAFAMARDLAPAALFIEDLDLIGGPRGQDQYADMLLGELMNELDGIEDNSGVLVVATTNALKTIEPALKDRPSRFDVVIELPDVSAEVRRRYLTDFLAERGLDNGLFPAMDEAAAKCRTVAEVQEAVIRFFQRAIEQDIDVAQATSPLDLPAPDAADSWQAGRGQIGFAVDG